MTLLDHIALTSGGSGRYDVEINDLYWIVGGPNGGYLAAILAHAVNIELEEPARQLRGMTVHYLRPPVVGPAEVTVTVVQRGRSVAFVRCELFQNGKPVLLGTGSWGAERTGVDAPALALPDVPPPAECVPISSVRENHINLHDQWEILTPDPEVYARDGATPDLIWWVRPRHFGQLDTETVVALSDALPPPIFVTLTTPQGVPTIDLTVHIRAELDQLTWTPDSWFLTRFVTRHGAGGFIEEDGSMWLDGKLIAISRQLALAV